MIKIIKCPTCGENVGVPATAAGQIVNCTVCGTALRLRSRRKASEGEEASGGSSMGKVLEGSFTGTAIGSSAYGGGPRPEARNEGAALGNECEACGRTTDVTQLVEDKGRLICLECMYGVNKDAAKGKASAASRDWATESEGDRSRAQVERGRAITITPATLVGLAAAILWGAAQVWLMYHPRPAPGDAAVAASVQNDGKKATVAKPRGPVDVEGVKSAATPSAEEEATASGPRIADPQHIKGLLERADNAAREKRPEELRAIIQEIDEYLKTHVVREPGLATGMSVKMALLKAVAGMGSPPNIGAPPGVQSAQPPVASTNMPSNAQGSAPSAPPKMTSPAPGPANGGDSARQRDAKQGTIFDDPDAQVVEPALEHLRKGEWPAAAKLVQPLVDAGTGRLEGTQRLLAHILAAAEMGQGHYDRAEALIARISSNEGGDRATVLNRVAVRLALGGNRDASLRELEAYFATLGDQPDEHAVNLLGTALKMRSPGSRLPDRRVALEALLAREQSKLEKAEQSNRPGQQRWGIEWLGADEVKRRQSAEDAIGPVLADYEDKVERSRILAQDAELVLQRKQNQMRQGRASAEELRQARQALQNANDQVKALEAQLAKAREAVAAKKWLDVRAIPPVIPEPEAN